MSRKFITLVVLFYCLTVYGKAQKTIREWHTLALKEMGGNYDSALICAGKMLGLATRAGDHAAEAEAYRISGVAHYYLGQYPAALKDYQDGLSIAEKYNLGPEQAGLYNEIGTFYKKSNNYKDAKNAFQSGLRVCTQVHDTSGMACFKNDLGLVYELEGNMGKAEESFTEALTLYQKRRDTVGMAYSMDDLGDVLGNTGRFEKALNYAKQALQFRQLLNDPIAKATSLNNIGELYFAQKDYVHALPYFQQSLELSKSLKMADLYQHTCKMISDSYFLQKEFEKAYHFYDLSVKVKDSVLNEKNIRSINEMEAKYQNEKKQLKIENLNRRNEVTQITLQKQQNTSLLLSIIAVVALIAALWIFREYSNKRKAHKTISEQKKQVEHQKELIQEKNQEILDSIHYAKKIQNAIFPAEEAFEKLLPGSFVLFQPKDIVSGDFYWILQKEEYIFFAAADCTGHGVPGGFMSVLGNSLLNEVVNEKQILEPADILDMLRIKIINALRQKGSSGENKDGMDMCLCRYHPGTKELVFAAANNSLYLIREGTLKEYKADKQPIGISGGEAFQFTEHKLSLQTGDCIYIFTDGYADQFGGPKGKKFKYKQFEEILLANCGKSPAEQKQILSQTIHNWKGALEQVDDICVVGLRV